MAATASPALPLEYIRIFDLPTPAALPAEIHNRILYSRVDFIHAKADGSTAAAANSSKDGSGHQGGRAALEKSKVKSAGFNYSKALKAALNGAGSSVTSRGDGKYEGGSDFAVSDAPGGRAKFVHLTPDALASGNAERTLQELDKLQQQARPVGSTSAATAAKAASTSTSTAPPRSIRQQHADILSAKVLYDIGEEYDSGAGPQAPAAAAASCSGSGIPSARPVVPGSQSSSATPGQQLLRVPEHSVRELLSEGPTGPQQQLEVCVLLPEVASPAEVEVWLGGGGRELQVAVPGKYRLKLDLSYPVVDDTSKAKWSRAKRRLTLTLTGQGR